MQRPPFPGQPAPAADPPCGGDAQATTAGCLGPDSAVPLRWASQALRRSLGRCVRGNLDPLTPVAGGERMTAEFERILHAARQGPFTFHAGHGILGTTAPGHAAALVPQVHAWHP